MISFKNGLNHLDLFNMSEQEKNVLQNNIINLLKNGEYNKCNDILNKNIDKFDDIIRVNYLKYINKEIEYDIFFVIIHNIFKISNNFDILKDNIIEYKVSNNGTIFYNINKMLKKLIIPFKPLSASIFLISLSISYFVHILSIQSN